MCSASAILLYYCYYYYCSCHLCYYYRMDAIRMNSFAFLLHEDPSRNSWACYSHQRTFSLLRPLSVISTTYGKNLLFLRNELSVTPGRIGKTTAVTDQEQLLHSFRWTLIVPAYALRCYLRPVTNPVSFTVTFIGWKTRRNYLFPREEKMSWNATHHADSANQKGTGQSHSAHNHTVDHHDHMGYLSSMSHASNPSKNSHLQPSASANSSTKDTLLVFLTLAFISVTLYFTFFLWKKHREKPLATLYKWDIFFRSLWLMTGIIHSRIFILQ